jgi:hypothetical protein
MRPLRRLQDLRPLTLVALLTLALSIAACGDSDDGDSTNGEQSGGADTTATSSGGGSERDRARASVEALYDAMADTDAEGVCAQLSASAQKQIAEGGLGGKGKTCAAGFQQFLDAAAKQGGLRLTLKAEVESVKVKGDKGTAHVTFGNEAQGDIPLVKEDGEWRLEATSAAP